MHDFHVIHVVWEQGKLASLASGLRQIEWAASMRFVKLVTMLLDLLTKGCMPARPCLDG